MSTNLSQNPNRKGGEVVAYDPDKAAKAKTKKSSKPKKRPDDDEISQISAEYSPPDEEEPRFKYSTADLHESSPRNTKCCLIAVAILCIILAIGLSVLMVKMTKKSDANNAPATAAPAPTAAPIPGDGMFAAPKKYVQDRCSAGNFASKPDGCKETCDGFRCCDPSLPKNQSCLFYNEEGCYNYARCHVNVNGIDPPNGDLDTACAQSRLAKDPSQCQNLCSGVTCCYQYDVVCGSTNFYTCLDYGPCQNLRKNVLVPVARDTIGLLCDPGNTASLSQSSECEDACAPAKCCWSDGADNCLQTDFYACMSYLPCTEVKLLPPSGEVVPIPPKEINSLCSVSNVAKNKTACEAACNPGMCCVQTGDTSCFIKDPAACMAYEPCKRLM